VPTDVHTDAPHLVSVGYEGRSVADLIQSLRAQSVRVLVDVRLTPLSRKKGLSKTALCQALADAGIRYVHYRQLGNPKDNREDFRQGSPASRQRYRDLLEGGPAADALRHVSELLDEGVVALLCFERDHSECHRGVVADVLSQQRDLVVVKA
jgi:uncharacterized protein (DUF488 family)